MAKGRDRQRVRRLLEPRQPKIEDIVEVVGIVPGDAVVAFRRPHGFEQIDVGSERNVVLWRYLANASRLGVADRRVGLRAVLDAEAGENAGKPASQIAGRTVERGGSKAGGKQNDAEIGVLADGVLSSPRRQRRMRTPTERPGRASTGRRDTSACLEIGDAHARAIVAEAMHITWLQRIELRQAGVMEGLGNLHRL